jgi:hypothetical protein
MDISRMKKVLAGLSIAAMSLTNVSVAFAAYSDVPAGVWYKDAVDAFTADGILDSTQARFRGSDLANRAEFVKLLVELNGGLLSTPPAVASFDDAKASAWYYAYMEEAGKEGWVKGDGNCYGSHPCYARPAANINRAEAAALIVRAFALEGTGDAPQFVDNPSSDDVPRKPIERAIICGGNANLRGFPEYLEGFLNVPVSIANVWSNALSFDTYVPHMQFSDSLEYATAIGLSLRGRSTQSW